MTSILTVLILIVILGSLWLTPSSSSFLDPPPVDRDQQRLRFDLLTRR